MRTDITTPNTIQAEELFSCSESLLKIKWSGCSGRMRAEEVDVLIFVVVVVVVIIVVVVDMVVDVVVVAGGKVGSFRFEEEFSE